MSDRRMLFELKNAFDEREKIGYSARRI